MLTVSNDELISRCSTFYCSPLWHLRDLKWMTAGHFVPRCHCWCEGTEKCVKCFTPRITMLLSPMTSCSVQEAEIAVTVNEQPLLSGICCRVWPWPVDLKRGTNVGMKSAHLYVCLSSCWFDSLGFDSCWVFARECLSDFICMHGSVSVCCRFKVCICPLDLDVELCGLVRQNAGHALPATVNPL